MAVDPTSGSVKTAVTPNTQVQRDNTLMGKDDFLKILVGQMQNMDPMSADSNDPTQSMAQMTQFSILEQLTNLASSQSDQTAAEKQGQAVALLGKTVSYTDSQANNVSGLVKNVDFKSDGTIKLTLDSGAIITPSDVSGVQ